MQIDTTAIVILSFFQKTGQISVDTLINISQTIGFLSYSKPTAVQNSEAL
jgi:hypothetical protein